MTVVTSYILVTLNVYATLIQRGEKEYISVAGLMSLELIFMSALVPLSHTV